MMPPTNTAMKKVKTSSASVVTKILKTQKVKKRMEYEKNVTMDIER